MGLEQKATPGLTYDMVVSLNPCRTGLRYAVEKLGQWKGQATARQAVEAGIPAHDVLWVLHSAKYFFPEVERRLLLWHLDIAARVLHVFESGQPGDAGVRLAIVAMREHARGEIEYFHFQQCVTRAWASCRSAGGYFNDNPSRPGLAASALVLSHPVAFMNSAQRASADPKGEHRWQLERLIDRMDSPEPEDWPLP